MNAGSMNAGFGDRNFDYSNLAIHQGAMYQRKYTGNVTAWTI
jgi:hypothetical protein